MSERYCSFCGASQYNVASLVSGSPTIAICCDCIRLCLPIIDGPGEAEYTSWTERTPPAQSVTKEKT